MPRDKATSLSAAGLTFVSVGAGMAAATDYAVWTALLVVFGVWLHGAAFYLSE